MLNNVVKSFEKYIKDNNIPVYVYSDTLENIDQFFTCRSKTPLTTLDDQFVLQVKVNDNFFDALNPNPTFLKFRYVKYNDNGIKYIQIVDYNNTTGEIILEKPFSKDMGLEDEFELVVLDSIFVTMLSNRDLGNQRNNNQMFIRLDMHLKTKQDSNKSKMQNIIETLQSSLGNYRYAPIYNDEGIQISQLRFENNGSYNMKMEKEDNMIEFIGSVAGRYFVSR